MVATMIRNAAFVAGNYSGNKSIQATDLFKLPQDILRTPPEPQSDIDSVKAFRDKLKDKYNLPLKLPTKKQQP